MKQYLIDELRPEEAEKVRADLEQSFGPSELGGIYWIPIGEDLLSEIQEQHEDCGPFYFAIDMGANQISCELLVRTRKKVRCQCMQYATQAQRDWLMGLVDSMFERLGIVT